MHIAADAATYITRFNNKVPTNPSSIEVYLILKDNVM